MKKLYGLYCDGEIIMHLELKPEEYGTQEGRDRVKHKQAEKLGVMLNYFILRPVTNYIVAYCKERGHNVRVMKEGLSYAEATK